jgi:hypothetical protein
MPQGQKRPGDGDVQPDHESPKLKMSRRVDDYSTAVRNHLQNISRTAQACDRCKVTTSSSSPRPPSANDARLQKRKIRCDALADGCSHCKSQGVDCNVTDRTTGRTERRGYLQDLEGQIADLRSHVASLEALLADHGVQVRPYGKDGDDGPGWSRTARGLWVKEDRLHGYSRAAALKSRPLDSHLGVSMDAPPLSSMKGTNLSILGTSIDITEFDAPDMDNNPPVGHAGLYNKSLVAFARSVTNTNPPRGQVPLPSRDDAMHYSRWYFLMIHPFMPVLHETSYFRLLERIYDDKQFTPTTSELVIVHMVFACIYFQYGVRNREEASRQSHLNELSDQHYHWSLSKFYELAVDQTLTSVQALVLIGGHTRSFPKPGCSSYIAVFTLTKAIDLGLHRETPLPPGQSTNLTVELRRRAWWNALSLLITLNGRLGKPMPLALDEFDTDFPVAIPDECLTEDGITDESQIGNCNFMVGLVGFKITPLYMEMYSNLYSARRDPRRYVDVVNSLEEQHRAWEESLPDELRLDKCRRESVIFALYAQAFSLELRLCLRHPSVCMTTDPKFCAENTRVCEETAHRLLIHVRALLEKKSLDTTWYQMSVYVAAMFCTLVAHWERRFETTAEQLAALKADMESWLAIITEIGLLIGKPPLLARRILSLLLTRIAGTNSGGQLSNKLEIIVSRTIGMIEHDMGSRRPTPPSQLPSFRPPPFAKPVPEPPSNAPENEQSYYPPPAAYPPAPSLPYPDPHQDAGQPPQPPPPANAGTYHDPNDYLYAAAAAAQLEMGNNPWEAWNAAISQHQDRLGADVLLNLGGHGPRAGVPAPVEGPGGNSHTGQWPLMLFHNGGTHNGGA